MSSWKRAALGAALFTAAGLGAAFMPAGHAQEKAPSVSRSFEFSFNSGSRIGVSIADVASAEKTGGVRIDEVADDSPASKAGLRKGDVVVEFDGERVRSVRQFTRLVNETPAGREVAVAVVRDGQRTQLSVTPTSENRGFFDDAEMRAAIEEARAFARVMPPRPPAAPLPPREPRAPREPLAPRAPRVPMMPAMPPALAPFWSSGTVLGVSVSTLSDQLKTFFAASEGVLVNEVSEGSAADKAGVKAGDVIVSVNGKGIDDPRELREEVSRIDSGGEFTLGIVRDKKTMSLKGTIEESARRTSRGRAVL